MNTNSSTSGSTSDIPTTQQQLSESTPTDTDSRLMKSATRRDLLIQISRKCSEIIEVDRSDVVICDSAEPKSIDEIHSHGFNTHGARKGRDSIRSGISFLHSRPLAVTSRSVNLIRELRNYKWKEDKNGKQLNEPVDSFNHAIDAMRYGITWNQTNPNFGSYAIG